MDAAPIWTNLKTFPWEEFRDKVDILSGGYPCQPFSAAGKRLGRDDPRHLWPWIADGIRTMRPRICFFENVEGHISLGLREVISELESIGYKATWGIFSAREVGAPHQRKRVFILAYDQRQRVEELGRQIAVGSKLNTAGDNGSDAWPSRPGEPQHAWEPPRVVGGKLGDSTHQRDFNQTQQDNAEAGADFDRTGEGERVAHAHGGRGEEPRHKLADILTEPSGCNGEAMGDTEHDGSLGLPECRGSHQDSNWCKEGSINAIEFERAGGSADCGHLPENQGGVMGNSESIRSSTRRTEHEGLGGQLCTTSTGSEGAMGNSETWRRRESGDSISERQGHWAARPSGSNDELSQAEPTLGGDSDGATDWLGHAKLFVTSDNRTDELRLLGNGVVPATATRAFLTLMDQLLNQ